METVDALREKFQWRKVQTPRMWNPSEVGEELAGYYGGRTVRTGSFGQYEIAIFHVPGVGSYMVSGTQLLQFLDAAVVHPGWPVRIVWKGVVEMAGTGHKMKTFEVFVAAGEAIPVEAMPSWPEART